MSTLPDAYRRLVDDAALFPPGNAPLPAAVAAHRRHRGAPHAGLVGPFVISDVRLPELLEHLRSSGATAGPLPVAVVVTGGAGAIEPAVRWATGPAEIRLAGLEVPLRGEDDLARNAQRVTTALDQLRVTGVLGDQTPVSVEPPRVYGAAPGHSWLAALDELAAWDLRLKLRTGGADADAFPSADELATCIGAALDRELPFKCTAGLHRALHHRDEDTGFVHHGFLDVLLATRAGLDGAGTAEVARWLEVEDPDSVRSGLEDAGADGLASARRWFTSFGSCSVTEPLADLVELGVLPPLGVLPEPPDAPGTQEEPT